LAVKEAEFLAAAATHQTKLVGTALLAAREPAWRERRAAKHLGEGGRRYEALTAEVCDLPAETLNYNLQGLIGAASHAGGAD